MRVRRIRRLCLSEQPGDAGTPRLAWALVKITVGSKQSSRKEQIRILLACEQQSSEQGLENGREHGRLLGSGWGRGM
jgi:hypothetical protein